MADETNSTGATDANFANAETIPANAKYIANFDGDEVNGKRYALGDELAADVDAGTIRYLVQNGRFTEKSVDDSNATATGGTGGTGIPTPADTGGDFDAGAFVNRNLDEITDDEIRGLTPAQRDSARAAEAADRDRSSFYARLDALTS